MVSDTILLKPGARPGWDGVGLKRDVITDIKSRRIGRLHTLRLRLLLGRGWLVLLLLALLAILPLVSQHLHGVGADFCGVAVLAGLLVLPFACAQAAFYIYLAAFAQVLTRNLCQAVAENHVVPFGGFFGFASAFVAPALGGGNGHIGYLPAIGEGA